MPSAVFMQILLLKIIPFVKDENSTNGTYVNGNRLTPNEEVQVFDGDIITFANEEFEFHI